MEGISLVVAFGAGVLSFLSPCVVPMAPVYLANIGGAELQEGESRARLPLMLHSVSFVIGFSVVFVALGVIAALTADAISPSYADLRKIAGGLLIAFGVYMLASTRIAWLNFERRLNPSLGGGTGYLRSFLLGGVFTLGWTPCAAPILGSILALASVRTTVWEGAFLLGSYSLGLGLPFLLLGAAFQWLAPVLRWLSRKSGIIHIISGLLLVVIGFLILTNNQIWLALF